MQYETDETDEVNIKDIKRAFNQIDDTMSALDDAISELYRAIDTARLRLGVVQSVLLDLLVERRAMLRD